MKTNTKGSAAPKKQQRGRKDPLDCYFVDGMPKNVVERSLGKVKCEADVENAVKKFFGGTRVSKTQWCLNNSDTLTGVALLMDNENFVNFRNLRLLEKAIEATVNVKAVGNELWLLACYWLDEVNYPNHE